MHGRCDFSTFSLQRPRRGDPRRCASLHHGRGRSATAPQSSKASVDHRLAMLGPALLPLAWLWAQLPQPSTQLAGLRLLHRLQRRFLSLLTACSRDFWQPELSVCPCPTALSAAQRLMHHFLRLSASASPMLLRKHGQRYLLMPSQTPPRPLFRPRTRCAFPSPRALLMPRLHLCSGIPSPLPRQISSVPCHHQPLRRLLQPSRFRSMASAPRLRRRSRLQQCGRLLRRSEELLRR